MRYLTIIVTILILSISNSLSKEKIDCTAFKKFSIQYTWCKSKNMSNKVKDKISNLNKEKKSKQ